MAAPIKITNQEFLEGLAGKDWRRVPISWGGRNWVVHPAGKNIDKQVAEGSNYFTVSLFRLDDVGRFIRQKPFFERQFVFVVDDVGTKLREGALRLTMPPATYELETSPDNYQFGYALTDGTDMRVLDALVAAVVNSKEINTEPGTDPGMKGVTRIARVPVGSNNKPKWVDGEGKGWSHQMRVWEPSRAYSTAELADWLDVDLSPAALEKFRDAGGTRKATEAELQADPLMKLFDMRGMLVDPTVNDNGFVAVLCPWREEHTSPGDEAGYRPGMGGFKCHHGHCEKRGMTELKNWVAEHVTPAEQQEAWSATFEDIAPDDPELVAEVARAKARQEKRVEEEKVKTEKIQAEWVFIVEMHRFGRVSTNQILPEKTFNSESGIAEYGKSGEKSSAAIFLNNMEAIRCKTASYVPGQDPICVDPEDESLIFNTWRPSGVTEPAFDVAEKDVAPWLDHVAFILPDPVARTQFLNWCAFMVQKPGQKINWAYLLIGGQGVGKDIMLRPIQGILGRANYTSISSDEFDRGWTDWAEHQLVIIEELPSFHKRDVYDWLKRYVAEGVPYFRVNKKSIPIYTVRNIQNWFIFSNHDDALALEADDRRYFVYRSPVEKREASYYAQLADKEHGVFEDPAFQGKVLDWLLRYDISAFNPGEAPPITEAKIRMMEETKHPIDRWLDEEFDVGGRFHGRRLLQAKDAVAAVHSEGRLSGISPEVQKITTTRVGRWLRQNGWHQLERVRGPRAGLLRIWLGPKESVTLYSQLTGAQIEEKYVRDGGVVAGGAADAKDNPF